MEFITELWLPILLSAVFVFIVSSLLHMVIPIHKGDFKKLPAEDKVLEAMREAGVSPGEYMFPCAGSMKEMSTPEMVAKLNQGPVGNLTVIPSGPFKMGRSLIQWFLYSILISLISAYVAYAALKGESATYLAAFRLTGAVSILAYATSTIHNSIWKGVSWGTTAKYVFDGIIYGLVTAGTFGWLWPQAAS